MLLQLFPPILNLNLTFASFVSYYYFVLCLLVFVFVFFFRKNENKQQHKISVFYRSRRKFIKQNVDKVKNCAFVNKVL